MQASRRLREMQSYKDLHRGFEYHVARISFDGNLSSRFKVTFISLLGIYLASIISSIVLNCLSFNKQ